MIYEYRFLVFHGSKNWSIKQKHLTTRFNGCVKENLKLFHIESLIQSSFTYERVKPMSSLFHYTMSALIEDSN